jgi:hypothetical protein
MLGLKSRRLGRRASASVELALVSVFFLLPLFAGSVDMVEIISAQAQVNTALRALYSFGWTNPNDASITTTTANGTSDLQTIINTISTSALRPISFPTNTNVATPNGTNTNGSYYYTCIPTMGTTLTQAVPCPTSGNIVYTQETWVTYQVNSSVVLPVPVPFVNGNTLTLTASGAVQLP